MSETVSAIVSEKGDQAIVIQIKAKLLDEASLLQLTQAIDAAAADSPQMAVVVNMGQVEFLPSLCLGALVQISHKCKGRSQRLKLAGLRPGVRKVFVVTRLDRTFELCDSLEAATRVPA